MKKRYLITYDLSQPNQNYNALYTAIETTSDGEYVRVCESSFLIRSDLQDSKDVYLKLKSALDTNDTLIVFEINTSNFFGHALKTLNEKILIITDSEC